MGSISITSEISLQAVELPRVWLSLSICFLSFYLKYAFFVLYFLKCKQYLLIISGPGWWDCFSKSWPVSYSSHQTLCCPHHTQRLRNNANVRSSYRANCHHLFPSVCSQHWQSLGCSPQDIHNYGPDWGRGRKTMVLCQLCQNLNLIHFKIEAGDCGIALFAIICIRKRK